MNADPQLIPFYTGTLAGSNELSAEVVQSISSW